MRSLTRVTLAALPLALALLLGGCGTEDGGDQVASAGGDQAEETESPEPSLSQHEMGVKFAQCMRENGIDMDDPKPGEGIKMKGTGVDQAVMEAAQEACREYNPQQNAGPEQQAEMAERGRQFAQCMRDNGVEAFQDPDPNQPGIRIDRSIAEDPDFEQAQQTCQELLAPGAGQ
jgi:hypothetical protein